MNQTDAFTATTLRLFAAADIQVILELGSRDGLQALELQRQFPHARVFAFECNPEGRRRCERNLSGSKVTLVPFAVHEESTVVQFFPAVGNIGASSLFPKSGAYDAVENFTQLAPIQVQAVRLDTWAHQVGVNRADMIWADLQGAELVAFKGLGQLLRTTKAIYTEVEYIPIYSGQPLFRDVDDFLLENGFFCAEHHQVELGCWGEATYLRRRGV